MTGTPRDDHRGSLALPVGVVLFVGATSCLAAPINFLVQGVEYLLLDSPIAWRGVLRGLPFTLQALASATFVGIGLGIGFCRSPQGRMFVARRTHVLCVLAGFSLLGWSLIALVFLLPFIDASTTLTGLTRSAEVLVIGGASAIAVLLAVAGAATLRSSDRIAEAARERVFGLDSRSCWTCGYPMESDRCPECGEPADRMEAALRRASARGDRRVEDPA